MPNTDLLITSLTLEGWYVLHQRFRALPPYDEGDDGAAYRERAGELADLFEAWEDLGADGWSGLYRIVGGGGTDYMAIHFRPSLDALGEVERELRRHPAAQDLELVGDYVSVVELGLYHITVALLELAEEREVELGSEEWDAMVEEAMDGEREKRYVQDRLRPHQPEEMPYVCFYPMDKRRNPGQNWYTLTVGERAELMVDHGRTGRRYAGRISQVITGSVGLDDWEWAVTLFGRDPLDFKALITEMRYDEVSSVYAEFGSFWVGHRVPTGEIVEELGEG